MNSVTMTETSLESTCSWGYNQHELCCSSSQPTSACLVQSSQWCRQRQAFWSSHCWAVLTQVSFISHRWFHLWSYIFRVVDLLQCQHLFNWLLESQKLFTGRRSIKCGLSVHPWQTHALWARLYCRHSTVPRQRYSFRCQQWLLEDIPSCIEVSLKVTKLDQPCTSKTAEFDRFLLAVHQV